MKVHICTDQKNSRRNGEISYKKKSPPSRMQKELELEKVLDIIRSGRFVSSVNSA